MSSNLITSDLDFDTIKENLISYLKTQDQFSDYEYEGSSLNVLLDILAYNTHYMGYYAHMLANESTIDSIIRKENMNAKAKFLNYLPKSKKSAKALVTITVDAPITGTNVKIDRGTSFKPSTPLANTTDLRSFVLIDDLYIYYNAETEDFTSEPFNIYEGSYETVEFLTSQEQRYVIRDYGIDTDTIKVIVKDDKDSVFSRNYTLAKDYNEINGESDVFFLSLNENDYYEITFGNDIYGRAIEDNSYVQVTYVSCNGQLGNTVDSFTDQRINVIESANDGLEQETIDDLRHNIQRHYRRQDRLVTVNDYKNIILSEFKNINSVNVWGGEDNIPIAYGKVFICIKPKFGETLSYTANKKLIELLSQYSVATAQSVVVDPEYLYVNLDVKIKNNTLLTNKRDGELKKLVVDEIESYDNDVLNKFDSYYSDVKINTRIMNSSPSFMSTYNNINLEKRFIPNILSTETYFVYFLNSIVDGTLTSNTFYFRTRICKMEDDGSGNLVVYYYDNNKKDYVMYVGETFGEVDYENGIVKISDIVFQELIESDIKLFVEPVNPLFFSKLNNIVTINNIEVTIEQYHGRETEKT